MHDQTSNMKKSLFLSTLIVATSLALLGANPVRAQDGAKKKDPAKKYEKLDTDKNGSVSLDEFKASKKDPAKAESVFNAKDTNKDGALSLEEFSAKKPKSPKKDKSAAPAKSE
ncbi:EF-hand domain-containing protein [bacterium]|nr:EF-hand domain-containing protein [bacterium]